ncbi:MAG: TonB-dependent receptor [Balneolales bacterium]
MTRLKDYSLFFLLLLVAQQVTAQHTISGHISHEETSEPFEGVRIYLSDDVRMSHLTDEEGYFEINDIPNGSYNYTFFLLGYEVVNRRVDISGGDAEFHITLQEISREFSEFTITEQQEINFSIKRLREVEGTAIYAGKKNEVVLLENMVINTASNNARQIYSHISGLNIYESNDAGLQLNIGGRGLDPNRSSHFNTRQNGYDISADVLGYPESYYTPPAEALDEIQVIRGAASLQYGTQFGGLVNFKMKSPNRAEKLEWISRQTTGTDNLFTSFNSVSGSEGKIGYYGYFNYKQGSGSRPNSEYDSKNLYTHLDYHFGENTSLALELTWLKYLAQQPGGLTDAQFYQDPSFSNRSRNWFDVDWKLAALKLKHTFNDQIELGVNVFGLNASRKTVGFRTNRVSQQDDVDEPRDLIFGDFKNWGAEGKLLSRYTLFGKNSVFLIGSKYYQSQNTSVQGPGTAGSKPNFNLASEKYPFYPNQSDFVFPNKNIAVFGEHILYLTENLSITPGLRFEHIRTQSEGTYKRINFDLAGNPIQDDTFEDTRNFDRQFVLFGLGLSYFPRRNMELYGNFSQNYRSVTFNDIRIVNPSFQVDQNISDERGFTSDFGIRGNFNNLLLYDIGGFGLLYDDRLGEVLRAELRQNAKGEMAETGRVVRFRGNIGQAFTYGFESLLDLNLSQLFNQDKELKLNLFLNTSLTNSNYFESDIPGIEGNQVEFIPLVNMKSGLNFGYKNVTGSLQYTYLSEQFTDASNAQQNRKDNQSGIKGEIPAYDVVDISLSYSHKMFNLETGINNLLDNAYFTQRATGYPGPGIIPSPPRVFYATLQFQLEI